MASGKTHEKINIVILIILLIITSIMSFISLGLTLVFVIGYLFGTYWFGPDLDIKSRPYNRWGKLRHMWKPYQKLGHRSVFTHGILIGDVIRFIYVLAPIFIVSFIVSDIFKLVNYSTLEAFTSLVKNTYFRWFFIGNVVASASHTITDIITSAFKRFWRRMRYNKKS